MLRASCLIQHHAVCRRLHSRRGAAHFHLATLAGTSCAQHQTNSIGSIQMRAGSHSHTQLTADNLQASIMPEAVLRGKSFALNSAVATRAMQGTWWPLIMKTAMAPVHDETRAHSTRI